MVRLVTGGKVVGEFFDWCSGLKAMCEKLKVEADVEEGRMA